MSTTTKIRMRDIADKVGVSRTAVSFVLNGLAREKGVSQKLEKKILQVAKSLNYRPSLLAKSLMLEKSMTIAVILPSLSGASVSWILKAMDVQAQKNDYQLMLAQYGNDYDNLVKTVNQMLGRHIDGILMIPPLDFHKSELFHELKMLNKPVVFFERSPDDPEVNIVTVDTAGAITICMQHLYDLGHRRIALCNPPKVFVESQTREMAYRSFCQSHNIDLDENLILTDELIEDESIISSIRQKNLRQLFVMDSPPTSLIAVSSTRAIDAYQVAGEMGLSIPHDLSLVAITGLTFTGFHKAIITSARFSYEDIGKVAFRQLLELIQDPTTSMRKTFLPASLVVGNTTAGPRVF